MGPATSTFIFSGELRNCLRIFNQEIYLVVGHASACARSHAAEGMNARHLAVRRGGLLVRSPLRILPLKLGASEKSMNCLVSRYVVSSII